ncbi:MAG: glycosyltransferase family 9 protein [Planctomycetota bacterium]|jgi:ADP-heptose:LPS heptosyltransferase
MALRQLPTAPRNILLVRLSSIGDVVCAMPLAMGLRRLYPKARLRWAVEPDAAVLLQHHDSGAEPVLVPRRGSLSTRSRTVRLLREVQPELVVDAQGNTKSGTVARLAARGAPILGFHKEDVREWSNLALTTIKAPPSGEEHTVRRNLALLDVLGGVMDRDSPDYGLSVTEDELTRARERLGAMGVGEDAPVAILHPGKLRDIRTWPAENHRALAASLRANGWTVGIEGPDPKRTRAERAMLDACFDDGALDLTDGLPLRDLVALLRHLAEDRATSGRPHVLVSPDTVLPHLAAAVGLPVVLLAGPQDPARTGPLGGKTVAVTAWQDLACAPCRKRRCHFEIDRACMERISVGDVARAVRTVTG